MDDLDNPWQKAETVDPEVRAHIYSLVNAVGGSSSIDDTYQVGDDAYAALQDLTKWLRLVREIEAHMML
jgi:replication fork protection complex subunit Tof1/Swi1